MGGGVGEDGEQDCGIESTCSCRSSADHSAALPTCCGGASCLKARHARLVFKSGEPSYHGLDRPRFFVCPLPTFTPPSTHSLVATAFTNSRSTRHAAHENPLHSDTATTNFALPTRRSHRDTLPSTNCRQDKFGLLSHIRAMSI